MAESAHVQELWVGAESLRPCGYIFSQLTVAVDSLLICLSVVPGYPDVVLRTLILSRGGVALSGLSSVVTLDPNFSLGLLFLLGGAHKIPLPLCSKPICVLSFRDLLWLPLILFSGIIVVFRRVSVEK